MQYEQAADAGHASPAVIGDAGHVADDTSLDFDLPKIGDAFIHGDPGDEFIQRRVKLGISLKGAKTKPGEWQNADLSILDLIILLSQHEEGAKDGKCILQGEVIDGERKAQSVRACYILMLDLDTGEDLNATIGKIKGLGLAAMVWTTHSHLKPTTSVKKDAVVRFIKEKREPTLDDVKRYLLEVKRYRPYILDGAELGAVEHTKEGIQLVIKHEPMPKFRVLFVLEKPFVFADFLDNRTANEAWKTAYERVSDSLGAFHDRSCTDPSRLMYTPRHAQGATGYEVHVIAGKALDLFDLPAKPASVWEDIAARDAAVIPAHEVRRNEYKFETPWLPAWLSKNAGVFLVEEFFHAHGEHRGAASDGAGQCFKCPNDDAHSNADDPADNGFYCLNPGSGHTATKFVAGCKHDSCPKNDSWPFIDMMVSTLGLQESDLAEFCDEGLREGEPDSPTRPAPSSAKAGGGVDETGTPDAESDSSLEDAEFTISQTYDEDNHRTAHIIHALNALNKEWAFVTMGSSIRYMKEPTSNDEAPTFFTKGEFQEILAPKKINVPVGDEFKAVPLARLWLDWPKRREYMKGVVFDPGAKPDPKKYNLYRGIPTATKKGTWKRLRHHLFFNVCKGDRAAYRFVLLWLAQLFQCPGVKIGSSIVMIGKKGTGKSKLWYWILEALKHHGIEVSDSEHIFSKFNAHTRGVLLMVCEEAFWAGDRKAGGKLKALITQENHLLELKGVDAVKTKNFMRLVFVSNESWVVPAGMPDDERRYFILEVGDARQDDHDYFEGIDLEMEAGGLEAMVHDLMHIDPMKLAPGRGWKALRKPPATAAHVAQAEAGMGLEEQFFFDALNNGVIETIDRNTTLLNLTFPRREDGEGPFYLSVAHLRGLFDEYADRVHIRRPTPHAFRKYVREWFLVEDDSTSAKPFKGSGKVACYKVPPLEDIREHHEERGRKFDALPEEE